MTDFKDCLIRLIFRIFHFLQKSAAAHTKINVCVIFHVNMFDQAHYSLISPFSDDNFSRLVTTSGFNRSFKWQMKKSLYVSK